MLPQLPGAGYLLITTRWLELFPLPVGVDAPGPGRWPTESTTPLLISAPPPPPRYHSLARVVCKREPLIRALPTGPAEDLIGDGSAWPCGLWSMNMAPSAALMSMIII